MRKMMKKVAVCAATMAMTVAMSCIAFAGDGSAYKVVGAEGLVGEDWKEANQTEDTSPGAPGEMGLMTEVEGMENVYSVTLNIAAADQDKPGEDGKDDYVAGYEFKILKDADDFAWTYQCAVGHPSMAWGDNQTQFKMPGDAIGEVTIYLDSTTGAVVILDKDNNALPYTVRWQSKDEHPWAFTAPIKAAIEAAPENPTTGWKFEDVPEVEKINGALYEKLSATAPTYDSDSEGGNEGSSEDASGDEKVTNGSDDDETTTPKATEADKDDEDSSSNTVMIVVIVIVVVVIIAAVGIVLSKKKD